MNIIPPVLRDQAAIDEFFARPVLNGTRLKATIWTHDGKRKSETQTTAISMAQRDSLLARFDMSVNGTLAVLDLSRLWLAKAMAFAPDEYAVLFYE